MQTLERIALLSFCIFLVFAFQNLSVHSRFATVSSELCKSIGEQIASKNKGYKNRQIVLQERNATISRTPRQRPSPSSSWPSQ